MSFIFVSECVFQVCTQLRETQTDDKRLLLASVVNSQRKGTITNISNPINHGANLTVASKSELIKLININKRGHILI